MELSIAILVTCLLILLVFKVNKRSKTKDLGLNLPPGPWKLPLIGNMHQLITSLPHRRLRDLAKKYGPIMNLKLGEVSAVVVTSPEIAKEMLKTHDTIFANRPFLLVASLIFYDCTDIVFAPFGDYWRELRRICITELLSLKRVQSYRSIREDEVSHLVSYISSNAGSPINLTKKIFSLTYSIVARAAFGEKYEGQEEFIALVDEVVTLGSGFSVAEVFPSSKWLRTISGIKPTLEKVHQGIDRMLEDIINEHKSGKAAEKNGKDAPDDLVDVLLKIQRSGDDKFTLTNDNVKGVILDVFSAGSETSSTTVEWTMSEMLRNPRVMRKAQAEVRQVFSETGNVEEAGLQELKYLKMVVKETMRLHPSAPLLIPRESSESCKISGYDIPAKTKVIVNAWAIATDPKYWTDAETFFPERFLDNQIDYKGTNFEFIPFGAGRRICPGMSFGVANVELALANLLYHFDWKSHDGSKLEDLDMAERLGGTVRRKNDLVLIPVPYNPAAC